MVGGISVVNISGKYQWYISVNWVTVCDNILPRALLPIPVCQSANLVNFQSIIFIP